MSAPLWYAPPAAAPSRTVRCLRLRPTPECAIATALSSRRPPLAFTSVHGPGTPTDAPPAVQRIALLGNHLPRQCGIATFTTDLAGAIAHEYPTVDGFVVAMNDVGRRHAYPTDVRFEIDEDDPAAYRRAVDFLNVSQVDVVSLQHEYGIFGGPAGRHVLAMLDALTMPVVTTLHTILATPTPAQRDVMDALVRRSERLVVMSTHGARLLQQVHHVPASRIDCIPHGIPDAMFAPGDKARLGVAGRSVLLTFGLLSPDKGIEYVIDAMPRILARFPDAVYILLGATHPHVLAESGETYRQMLAARAAALGVSDSVIVHNRFVSQAELGEYLAAADIYLTPYLNPEQSTSGALAYAVGAGKAVVSTPFRYALEVLDDGRGLLVPPRDAPALADAVVGLLEDGPRASTLRAAASRYGRGMAWSMVAHRHMASLASAVASHRTRRRVSVRTPPRTAPPARLPAIDLAHLQRLTDDTGMLQHAHFDVPRYDEGYCLDDNARALLLCVGLAAARGVDGALTQRLTSRYLAFVHHAFVPASGRFRNFLSYGRSFAEAHGSDDSHGRALWALGAAVGHAPEPGRSSLSGALFAAALPAMLRLSSPRAWAYSLLGIDEYLHAFAGDRQVQATRDQLAERLADLFARSSAPDWPWFEGHVTYCNARLPQALIVSGAATGQLDVRDAGLRALAWLDDLQCTSDGVFAPVGSNGFYPRGTTAAAFDQQPVEACGMIAACVAAHRVTGDRTWLVRADRAFGWFLGHNHLHLPLYDATTGGCRDGLHADRVNENQGAESTLSFLLALLDMQTLEPFDRP